MNVDDGAMDFTNPTNNVTVNPTPVTVIGLGLMGQALAHALLDAGHPTTVWNRTTDKARDLVTDGATLAASAGEAIAASQLVVVCVSDYDAVHAILDPVAADLKGRTVVNASSGTSREGRETADWARQHGIEYLDGAILTVPQGIGQDNETIVFSGPRSAYDTYEHVFRHLAGRATYLGSDHGLASMHDATVLSMMWGILNSFLHGAALITAAGVKASGFTPIVKRSMATVSDWLEGYADQIDRGEHPGDDATIATHLAAMEHLIDESEQHGISSELPRFFKALADRGVTAGHAENGYTALIEQFRGPA